MGSIRKREGELYREEKRERGEKWGGEEKRGGELDREWERKRIRDVDEFSNSGGNFIYFKEFWKRRVMGCSIVILRKGGYGWVKLVKKCEKFFDVMVD